LNDLRNQIRDFLGTLRDDLSLSAEATGKAIDDGVAKGITDNKQVVINALKSVLEEAFSAGQTAIESGSPSKRAARMLGAPIAQGVGVGIDGEAARPVAAIRGLLDGVFTAGERALRGATPQGNPLLPVAAYQGVNNGGGTAAAPVTIHVHGLQGDIRSPHTWDDTVASAISKSVQRQRIIKHVNDPDFGARR
jgi:hypothetical protein